MSVHFTPGLLRLSTANQGGDKIFLQNCRIFLGPIWWWLKLYVDCKMSLKTCVFCCSPWIYFVSLLLAAIDCTWIGLKDSEGSQSRRARRSRRSVNYHNGEVNFCLFVMTLNISWRFLKDNLLTIATLAGVIAGMNLSYRCNIRYLTIKFQIPYTFRNTSL